MFEPLLAFFRTRPDKPLISDDKARIRTLYERRRWSVFLSTMIGYGMFYTCRINFSVAKKPMLDEGVLDTTQMGIIGSVMLIVYAVGKASNGFLADRANIARFMSTGLLISALANLAFGFTDWFMFFALLWGVSGWFQSMGSAPSVVAISHWFSNKERGTRYGLWSTCHSIGEALTFLVTASLVAWLGWRWGFWGPGLLCVLAALVMYKTLADRPQTYGLPHINEYKQDFTGVKVGGKGKATGRAQLAVLKNPYIWILGMASASIYMARYGMNNWGVLYLQEAKGYDLVSAGAVMGTYPLLGLAGAAVSGWFSDRFFGSRRTAPALLFGFLELGSLIALFLIPPEMRWADMVALGCFGFALGGLLVYLGGLMAVDLSAQDAAGAAMGVVGMFSYMGAALQDTVSGMLLDADSTVIDGVTTYDFTNVQIFWVGASALSIVLAAFTWPAYRKVGSPASQAATTGGADLG